MKLTPEMAQRYDDGAGVSLGSPCVICGGRLDISGDGNGCGHWQSGETEAICTRLKRLGKKDRDKLRKGLL